MAHHGYSLHHIQVAEHVQGEWVMAHCALSCCSACLTAFMRSMLQCRSHDDGRCGDIRVWVCRLLFRYILRGVGCCCGADVCPELPTSGTIMHPLAHSRARDSALLGWGSSECCQTGRQASAGSTAASTQLQSNHASARCAGRCGTCSATFLHGGAGSTCTRKAVRRARATAPRLLRLCTRRRLSLALVVRHGSVSAALHGRLAAEQADEH
jgi:hypothetical protein